MKLLRILVVGILVVGAATLWAAPEEEPEFGFRLTTNPDVPPDQVRALTDALQDAHPEQVRVDATFLRVDPKAAPGILGEHHPERTGSAKPLPPALAARLLELAGGRGPVQHEPLPPLVLYAGQRGRLTSSGRHLYLQDYDAEDDARGAPQPVVGQIEDGAAIEIVTVTEGESLVLEVAPTWAETVRPIPRFAARIGLGASAANVRIELPELRLVQLRERVVLPVDGGYVLVGSGTPWGEGRDALRIILLRVQRQAR